MQDIQQLFERIQKNKEDQKKIKNGYQDALRNSKSYLELKEQIKALNEDKKILESEIKEEFHQEFIKLNDLQIDLETDMQLLTDIVLTSYVKGEPVEIRDQHNNQYEPQFKVNLKKAK